MLVKYNPYTIRPLIPLAPLNDIRLELKRLRTEGQKIGILRVPSLNLQSCIGQLKETVSYDLVKHIPEINYYRNENKNEKWKSVETYTIMHASVQYGHQRKGAFKTFLDIMEQIADDEHKFVCLNSVPINWMLDYFLNKRQYKLIGTYQQKLHVMRIVPFLPK